MTTVPGPNESLARRLLRSAAHFSVGQIVALASSILRIGVAARVLSAEANGAWLGLQLVLSYGAYLHLGSTFGLFRSVPMLRAQGRDEDAERERQTSLAFTLLMIALSTPVLLGVTLWIFPAVPLHQRAMITGMVGVQLLRGYYTTVYKAESRFREQARAVVLGAAASVLTLPLVVAWGLDGLLVSTVAQAVIETAVMALGAPIRRLTLERGVLKQQISVGAITLLTSLASLMLTTIDRTVMLHRLGSEATGSYYIGANIMILLPIVIGMPAAVLTPQFFERIGRSEDVRPLVAQPIELAALGIAAMIGVGSIVTEPTVAIVWPNLIAGTEAARAALFGTYPLVLAGLVSNVYYAHDRQFRHLAILVACAALSFGLANLGVTMTGTITGAAVGTAIGLYVYFPAATLGAYSVLGDVKAGARLALSASLPIVYAGGASLAVEMLLRWVFPSSPLQRGAVGLAAVSLLVLPLLLRVRSTLRARLAPAA